ncbi:hypothetical protein GCM10023187_10340 [Nibrella viscosa]|uniref:Inner membrane protein n=1 Tax=Nibrella viscosa TaxID=1084524 RepID=A0ABP8K172_9BACT
MPSPVTLYSASFTTGALLREETLAVLALLQQVPVDEVAAVAKKDAGSLKINSEVARQKIAAEIVKRYKAVSPAVWDFFQTLTDEQHQQLVLFYVCLKTYRLIYDFMFAVVVPRWQSRLLPLSRSDFERYLDELALQHAPIQRLTEKTRRKLAQIVMLMMKQAQLIQHNQLSTPAAPAYIWRFFQELGDDWMLDAGLLTHADRQRLGL